MENQNEVGLTRVQAKEISATISIINKKGIDAVEKWGILSKDEMQKLIKEPQKFTTFKGELSTFLDGIKHERLNGEAMPIETIALSTKSSMNQMIRWIPKLLKQ